MAQIQRSSFLPYFRGPDAASLEDFFLGYLLLLSFHVTYKKALLSSGSSSLTHWSNFGGTLVLAHGGYAVACWLQTLSCES